ncbi:phage terminase large subunit family protein [Escherichia coli]|nr:phage terminase large subunit family protein [Escherichia coli]HBD4590958.1 phage terminase large subunit family protein [Shigella sonnei]HBD6759223.1 phage terminase large subunit family protein [Shigella sonnei]HCM8577947.1 phage terminase large subunit family protein [Shigella boydii]
MDKQKKIQMILQSATKALQPPPKIKPSEWVEQNLYFPDGSAANQKVKLYEFQKEVIDQIINPKVTKVVIQSAAQLLKTSVLHQSAMYLLANRPDNMLMTAQTAGMMTKVKTSKWDKVLESCKALEEVLPPKNSKDYTFSNLQQDFLNGSSIYFGSMGTPKGLRSVTTKYIFLDEVSSNDITEEGNPITLAEQRTKVFADKKILISSTPTIPDDLICQQYSISDQRRFYVPCPHCEEKFVMEWEHVKFEFMEMENGRHKADASTCRLECPNCEGTISDIQRQRMISKGEWVATNPQITDVVGYQISRLYHPSIPLKSIVADFSDALYNGDLQSFYNNTLGMSFEDVANKEIPYLELEALRETEFDIEHIPEDVLGLFMAVDVQVDRIEVTTLGINDEMKDLYVLDHRAIHAFDTTKVEDDVWKELERYARLKFKKVDGKQVPVLAGFIDSGNGKDGAHMTVYRICEKIKVAGKNVFKAIKGNGTKELFKDSVVKQKPLVILNSAEGKNRLNHLVRLAISEDAGTYVNNIRFSHSLPEDAFQQLTSEKRIWKNNRYQWIKKHDTASSRNEFLDTLNYVLICATRFMLSLHGKPYETLRKYNETLNKKEEKPVVKETIARPQREGRSYSMRNGFSSRRGK